MAVFRCQFFGTLTAALVIAAGPCDAHAQSVDVGGTLGIGARSGEAEFIRTEARPVGGVRVAVLWSDRVETAFRYTWLSLPAFSGSATYYAVPNGAPIAHVLTERTGARQFGTAEVLYLFSRGSRVRPFAGGGFGAIFERTRTSCDVADCAQLLPGLSLGPNTTAYADPVAIVGASGVVRGSFSVRGGVEFHRLAGEDLSLLETFVGVGYRF